MKKEMKKNLALVKNIYLSPLKNPDWVSVLKSPESFFLLGLVASYIGLELILNYDHQEKKWAQNGWLGSKHQANSEPKSLAVVGFAYPWAIKHCHKDKDLKPHLSFPSLQ